MAFDSAHGQAVLFGGQVGPPGVLPSTFLDDTWTFDGRAWAQRHPSTHPAGRAGAAMAYDPVRRTVLLWGGLASTGQTADFWSWDGAGWTEIRTPSSPPADDVPGWPYPPPVLVYDIKRLVMVLVRNGGSHPDAPRVPDAWTWDGSQWAQSTSTDAPTAWGTAAYDSTRGSVLFLGQDAYPHVGTWSYDGARWTQLSSPIGLTFQPDDMPPIVGFGSASTPTLVAQSGEI
ncbi:MAG TPA: hypothetical protein VHQ03_07880, partial [Candidatus Dormibacteraeota bacterium]|nr:hypothetical protein [Candidatus Dormibacteraeota bacterium]